MKKYCLLFVLFILVFNPVLALQKGQIEYIPPMDYSVLNETEINLQAENLFNEYISCNDIELRKKLLNDLLAKYSTLILINKEKAFYFTRLGIIFDKLGNDRRAKSNFFRATNMSLADPYAYYSFGNYYFARSNFKLALRAFLHAYNNGYDKNYDNLYKIGAIYEKYGDYTSAIKYYKLALNCKPNDLLQNKILILEDLLKSNSLYNENKGKR